MGDYSSERYNPTFPHCGQLRLFFEGSQLRMSGGSQTYSYLAVSGRPVNGPASITAWRGNGFPGKARSHRAFTGFGRTNWMTTG
jgi:hypothetical protein